jgi:hypothetical protein
MSATGSSLGQVMERNISEVFGERNPSRRRAAIAELYADDCAMYDTEVESVGQAAISERVDGILGESPPEFAFQPCGPRRGDSRPRPRALADGPRRSGAGRARDGRCPLRERKDPDAVHIRRDAAHRRPKLKSSTNGSRPAHARRNAASPERESADVRRVCQPSDGLEPSTSSHAL